MSDILLLIPAFNEEANIENVTDKLIKEFPELDYVIINDGSTDSTADICRQNKYNFIDLPVNLGLAGAFQTGMRYALENKYSYAVQFDGDGQHRAEYIKSMHDKMDEGYDIVIASRFVTEKKPNTLRMLGSNIIEFAIKITTGVKLSDPTSGMRMYSQNTIAEFAAGLNYAPEPDTISYFIKQGAKVGQIQASMDERIGGVSYLTPFNAAKYMVRMLVSILLIQNFRKRDYRYRR